MKNIIDKWIYKYGDPKIENKVCNQIKIKFVKSYCKEYKLKFVSFKNNILVAFKYMPVMAGMEVNLATGEVTNYKIRKTGMKKYTQIFLLHPDNDIQQIG